jgi:hypothetical protein
MTTATFSTVSCGFYGLVHPGETYQRNMVLGRLSQVGSTVGKKLADGNRFGQDYSSKQMPQVKLIGKFTWEIAL